MTAVLPDLVDNGVEVWETAQLHALPLSAGSHAGVRAAPRVPRRDQTRRLPFASPAEVADEVRRVVEDPGEGCLCGPDHHIKPDVGAAQTLALFDAATALRRPGYTTG